MDTRSSNRRPLFSVLMANYNYGPFIEKALQSVLDQTFPPDDIEIIVVDDGSTDDSRERLKKYEGKVRCIFKENGGHASAFNVGIAQARGEFVAFLDSDDYWHPMKLHYVYEELRRSESIDFVYHFMDVFTHDDKMIDRYVYPPPFPEGYAGSGREYLERYLKGFLPWFAPTSAMTVRTDCLRKALPIPEAQCMSGDIYLHYLLPFYMRGLSLIRKPLGYYRVHGANISGCNLLTLRTAHRALGNLEIIRESVEEHARRLGYDSSLLQKRLGAAITRYKILADALAKKKGKALKDALLFNDYLPGESSICRLLRKAALIANIILPPSVSLWLQRKYRILSYQLQRDFLDTKSAL